MTIVDPATTWIDDRATIGPDTVVEPFVVIRGPVTIGRNCRIAPHTHLRDRLTIPDNSNVGAGPRGACGEAA